MKKSNKQVVKTKMISRIVSELSKYGGEWKTIERVDRELSKMSEKEKKDPLEWQIRYHKHVLKLQEILPKEKKSLLALSKPVQVLEQNLKEIISISPHIGKDLQDLDEGEIVRLTSTTVLTQNERKTLYDERINILNERLKTQRLKLKRSAEGQGEGGSGEDDQRPQTSGKRAKLGKRRRQKLDLPDPISLIGKRVDHSFYVHEEGKKLRSKKVFTGTVIGIARESQDPLYTIFTIRYDVDNGSKDLDDNDDDDEGEEDEEELQTDWNYELLIDYVNGDLKLLEDE